MKNCTCVWRNIRNTARASHSQYYEYFAKHACNFSLILLEPCKMKSRYRLIGDDGHLYYKQELQTAINSRNLGIILKIFAVSRQDTLCIRIVKSLF